MIDLDRWVRVGTGAIRDLSETVPKAFLTVNPA
jgi:hypothetical protein